LRASDVVHPRAVEAMALAEKSQSEQKMSAAG